MALQSESRNSQRLTSRSKRGTGLRRALQREAPNCTERKRASAGTVSRTLLELNHRRPAPLRGNTCSVEICPHWRPDLTYCEEPATSLHYLSSAATFIACPESRFGGSEASLQLILALYLFYHARPAQRLSRQAPTPTVGGTSTGLVLFNHERRPG